MGAVTTTQILVSLTDGSDHPIGSCWSFKTKKNDFYLEPVGQGRGKVLHLSLHGPWPGKPNHRFHIKVDENEAAKKRSGGQLVEHGFPAGGLPLAGVKVANDAYLVCRLRWMPALQQPQHLAAASAGSGLPSLTTGREGRALNAALAPGSAWDLDVIVSFTEPYWPSAERTAEDNARLGPLQNEAGMYLTVSSFHRSLKSEPAPDALVPDAPDEDETPNLLMCGGLDERPEGDQDLYWFVETIVSRELLERSFPHQFEN